MKYFKMSLIWVVCLVFWGLAIFLWSGCGVEQTTKEVSNKYSNDIPDIQKIYTIKDYEQAILFDEGLEYALDSGYDYTVLIFAAYWCSPCREIDHMFDRYKNTHSASFNVYVSEINMNPELADLFSVERLPNFVLLTKKGDVFEVYENFEQIPPKPFFDIYVDYWLLDIALDDERVLNDWRLNDYE